MDEGKAILIDSGAGKVQNFMYAKKMIDTPPKPKLTVQFEMLRQGAHVR
ncbi:MAG TPA: hypothetical protein VG028_03775 [Terriglobia bacterium]|nr:hypothetical protein [Terriglobia bacterium]